MTVTLLKRIAKLEARRSAARIEIIRERPDGTASLTIIRHGRVIERHELAAGETGRTPGEIVIERSYAHAG